jgi:hypothetical protein
VEDHEVGCHTDINDLIGACGGPIGHPQALVIQFIPANKYRFVIEDRNVLGKDSTRLCPVDRDLMRTSCGPVGYPKSHFSGSIDAGEKSACHVGLLPCGNKELPIPSFPASR